MGSELQPCLLLLNINRFSEYKLDVPGSLHRKTNLIKMTNKMQLCKTIYYSNVDCSTCFEWHYCSKPVEQSRNNGI